MPLLTAEDYQRFPTVEPHFRYAYGADAQQFCELTLPPADPPHPVIVLVHGGGYREMYDLRPLGAVVAALAEAGFAVWNIEYRRFGNGGEYPAMFLDVAAAADLLRTVAAERGLDPGAVFIMGHSAGGHLALWLAGRPKVAAASPLYASEPLTIQGLVALAPLADVSHGSQSELSSDALLAVMGGTAKTAPDAYRNGCPGQLLPLNVPQILVVGEEDADMLANAKRYIQSAQAAGDEARLIQLPAAGHFEIVATRTPAWSAVMRALRDLRRSCAKY